jgi:hypothetical protein
MRNDPENTTVEEPARQRRTLKVCEWPEADRIAWEAACRPSHRLKKGGSASYLKARSQDDYARRYGLFLGFLRIKRVFDRNAAAAAHVTPENIRLYLDDLASRVQSGTAWNSISMVRRAAQFIAPDVDFRWLREIENDLAFVMQPKSKLNRRHRNCSCAAQYARFQGAPQSTAASLRGGGRCHEWGHNAAQEQLGNPVAARQYGLVGGRHQFFH